MGGTHSNNTSSSDDGVNINATPPNPSMAQLNSGNNWVPRKAHIDISQTLLPASVMGSQQSINDVNDLMLNVWEFSGHNTALSAHQFFSSDQQTAFIVTFNLLQPNEHQSYIEHWLQFINSRAKDAPVILVGTHADDRKCTKDYIEATFRTILQRTKADTQYPNLRFLYDIDTGSSYSLKALRRSIYDLATAPIAGSSVPSSSSHSSATSGSSAANVPTISSSPTSSSLASSTTNQNASNASTAGAKDSASNGPATPTSGSQGTASGSATGSTSATSSSSASTLTSAAASTGASHSDFLHVQSLAIKIPESWIALEERCYATREQSSHVQAKKEDFFMKMVRRATGQKPPLSDLDATLSQLPGITQVAINSLKEAVSMDLNEKDHPTLIGYLNSVGAIVSLGKESGHVVLDPQWLQDAVQLLYSYRPATSMTPAGSNTFLPSASTASVSSTTSATPSKALKTGFLLISDIKENIWGPDPRYPPSEHQWLLELFEKFEILLPFDKKSLFVPWTLPPYAPSSVSTIWPAIEADGRTEIHEQRRYYVFNYLPTVTFFKLLSKLLSLDDWETEVYWRFGIVMHEMRRTAQVSITLDLETKTIKLIVRGRQQVLKMVAIAEAIEAIMTEAAPNKKAKYHSVVPCRHCISEGRDADASLFPLSALEAAVNKNPANAMVNCFSGKKPRTVRVDWLAPDVALSSLAFSGERIEFKDIELGNIIGEGGYATVYKGVWKTNQVAVKQVKLVNIVNNESDNVFAEFRREVQLMAGLQNENLVVLKAICMEPFCMVLEFMEQGSLSEFTHSPAYQSITWQTRIHLALDIARGMRFLHGMMPPIVHRDLKSPNILLTLNSPDGRLRAKVADFGLSRSLDFSRELDGSMLEGNNPVWLAPEILLQQNYNEKVDVYAFGLILFEMLSGQDYFGNVGWMTDIENMVIAGQRPTPLLVAEDPYNVQSDYVDLLKACWDPSPTERPTFPEICSNLTSLLKKTGVEVEDEPVQQLPAEDTAGGLEASASDTANSEEDGSDVAEHAPKRDMLREYMSQQASRSEQPTEEDGETAAAPSSPAASSPEPTPKLSSNESRRSVHAGSDRSGSPASSDSHDSSGGTTKKKSTKKRVSEKKIRKNHTNKESAADRESRESRESDDSEDMDTPPTPTASSAKESKESKDTSKEKTPRTKASSVSLGVSSGLSPNVRAQLSPRADPETKAQKSAKE